MIDNVKYNEKQILEDLSKYVLATYSEHYVGKEGIQTLDVWESLDMAEQMCQGTAIKYLMRFGKKDGKNKKDLLKALHYTILLMHFSGVMNEAHNGTEVEVKTNKRTRG